jgi:hypothetical protein
MSVAIKSALDLRAHMECEKHTSSFLTKILGTPFVADMSSFLWLISGKCPPFLWWIYGNPTVYIIKEVWDKQSIPLSYMFWICRAIFRENS